MKFNRRSLIISFVLFTSLKISVAEVSNTSCKVKFTSVYTNLKKDCPVDSKNLGEGQDPTHSCKEVSPYHAFIDYSAFGTLVRIIQKDKLLMTLPEQGLAETFKRNLEWRLANGKPFAVIYRVAQYSPQGLEALNEVYMNEKYKIGEKIIVRGLGEFSTLSLDLDTKSTKDINHKAQQIADEHYCAKK